MIDYSDYNKKGCTCKEALDVFKYALDERKSEIDNLMKYSDVVSNGISIHFSDKAYVCYSWDSDADEDGVNVYPLLAYIYTTRVLDGKLRIYYSTRKENKDKGLTLQAIIKLLEDNPECEIRLIPPIECKNGKTVIPVSKPGYVGYVPFDPFFCVDKDWFPLQ